MQYYVTNRTALLINPVTQNQVIIPSSDLAFPLIVHMIKNNRVDDLKFFTEIGHKLILNEVTIESTMTKCFNIYADNKIYCTLSSMYDEVIRKISNYEIDKIITLKSVTDAMRSITINISMFDFIKEHITLERDHVIAHGTYHDYKIDFETNSVTTDKNQHVCINIVCNTNFKDYPYTEKELSILGKTMYCINDFTLFPSDGILSRFVRS